MNYELKGLLRTGWALLTLLTALSCGGNTGGDEGSNKDDAGGDPGTKSDGGGHPDNDGDPDGGTTEFDNDAGVSHVDTTDTGERTSRGSTSTASDPTVGSSTGVTPRSDAGPPPEGETVTGLIPATGGEVSIPGVTVNIPNGAFEEETEVTVTVITPDEDVPEAVKEVTGIEVEVGGQTLQVPAQVTLSLPVGSTAEQVFVVANTETRAFEVPVSIQTLPDDSVVAKFSVVESGRYAVVAIVLPEGCDQIQAAPNLTATADDAIEQVRGITRLTGALSLSGPNVSTVEALECLVRVDGALTISNTGADNLEGLRNLAFVGGAIKISANSALESAALPSLLAARGGLEITQNTNLELFEAGSLGMVQGIFAFTGNGRAGGNTVLSMAGLKTVEGPFALDSNPGLIDLDGVGNLTTVGGLWVYGNSDLESVAGLTRLKEINIYGTATSYWVGGSYRYFNAGGLLIQKNDVLQKVTSLEALTDVQGTIEINANKELARIELPALSSLTGALGVIANPALTSFSADELEAVSGEVYFSTNGEAASLTELSMAKLGGVDSNFGVHGNPALQDLDGFNALAEVGGLAYLATNESLTNVDGLASLVSVGSSVQGTLTNVIRTGTGLTVTGNPALTDLAGLTALEQVAGSVTITTNAVMSNAELPALTSVGEAFVTTGNALLEQAGANALVEIPGLFTFDSNGTTTGTAFSFESLTSIGGNSSIRQNPTLTGTAGFPNLESVVGSLTIQSNEALAGLFAMSALKETGPLTISSNPLLPEVDLPSLIQVNGLVNVSQDAALVSVGLPALKEVRGAFTLSSNEALSDVSVPTMDRLDEGLAIESNTALYSVAMDSIDVMSSLSIENNGSLVTSTSLSFAALETVGGYFSIASNTSVNSLLGFPALNSVTGSFVVSNNPILPTCGAFELRDQVEAGAGITGTASISGNAVDLCSEEQ